MRASWPEAVAAALLIGSACPSLARAEKIEEEDEGELITLHQEAEQEPRKRRAFPVQLRLESRFIPDSDFGSAEATFYRPRGLLRVSLPLGEKAGLRLVADGRALVSDWDGTSDLFSVFAVQRELFDTLYSASFRLQAVRKLGATSLLAEKEEWSLLAEGGLASRFEEGADFGDGMTGGGGIAFGYHLPGRLDLIAGLSVSTRLDRSGLKVGPLVFLVWDITDRLRLRANASGGHIDFALTDEWTVFARARVRSTRYRLDARNSLASEGTLRERRVPAGLGVRWKPDERLRVSLFGGVVAQHEFRSYDSDRNVVNQIDSDLAPLFEARIDLRF